MRFTNIRSARSSLRFALLGLIVVATGLFDCTAGEPKPEKGFFHLLRNKPHWSQRNPFQRAGNPQCVSKFAQPHPNMNYTGYYTGGGAAIYGGEPDWLHGECRYPHEGTFGLDYNPWYSRVRMQWFHGRKYQAGEGQYEPDHANNPLDHRFGFGPFKRSKLKLTDPRHKHE
jgi:hypothetical protein